MIKKLFSFAKSWVYQFKSLFSDISFCDIFNYEKLLVLTLCEGLFNCPLDHPTFGAYVRSPLPNFAHTSPTNVSLIKGCAITLNQGFMSKVMVIEESCVKSLSGAYIFFH